MEGYLGYFGIFWVIGKEIIFWGVETLVWRALAAVLKCT
jgi:hypothetical protein